jgi:allantoin racemase
LTIIFFRCIIHLIDKRADQIQEEKTMAEKKRILNMLPAPPDTEEYWSSEPMEKILPKYVSPGFELDFRGVKYGGYEGFYYNAVTVPYIVDEIIQAEKEGYAAVTSQCYLDMGVTEAREAVEIPVVGSAEASLYIAMMCGDRIGIVTTGNTYRTRHHGAVMRMVRQMVASWGIGDRIVHIGTTRSNEFPAVDAPGAKKVFEAIEKESLTAIEEKGAEVIVLGCTGYVGYGEEMQKRLGVPVVDSAVAALKFAELLVTMDLTHSQLTTPAPHLLGVKPVMNWPPTLREYKG